MDFDSGRFSVGLDGGGSSKYAECLHTPAAVKKKQEGWEWEGRTFSVQWAYAKIRGEQFDEEQATIRQCRLLGRHKFQLKVQISGGCYFVVIS